MWIIVPECCRMIAVADVNTPYRSPARRSGPPPAKLYRRRTPLRGSLVTRDYEYVPSEGFTPPEPLKIHIGGIVSPGAAARLQVQHAGNIFEDVTFLAASERWLADATIHVTGLPPGLDFSWLVNKDFAILGERECSETLINNQVYRSRDRQERKPG
jgi:hypothetical protein